MGQPNLSEKKLKPLTHNKGVQTALWDSKVQLRHPFLNLEGTGAAHRGIFPTAPDLVGWPGMQRAEP